MKKLAINIGILILGFTSLNAQLLDDGIRFSRTINSGSARFASMGGAFSALGGDISVASINPAGIGVFRSSAFSFTPTFSQTTVESNYRSNSEKEFNYKFGVDNMGIILSYKPGKGSMVKNLNFGISFDKLNDFNENLYIAGNATPYSLLDTYVWDLNAAGTTPNTLNPFYEGLAYDAYLINYDTASGSFYNIIGANSTVDKTNSIERRGKQNEWNFSMGINIDDMLYLGAALGVQSIYFKQNSVYAENFIDMDDIPTNFQLTENRIINATGINFKFGFIAKPVQMLRISGSIHTPTIISAEEEFDSYIQSDLVVGTVYPYNADVQVDNYTIRTPFKTNAGLGIVLGKYGLISIDYDYLNYGSINFSSDDRPYASRLNDSISNMCKVASNIRAGLELRYGNLALRGGFGFYQSPYQSTHFNNDANYYTFSGGIGYREKQFFIDFGYVYYMYSENYIVNKDEFYDPNYRILSKLDLNRNKFFATIGFKF